MNINAIDDDSVSPLGAAAYVGHLETVGTLLRWKARLNGEKGSSALWFAVTGQHVKIVETLLEHRADVRPKELTHLHPFSKLSNVKVAQL